MYNPRMAGDAVPGLFGWFRNFLAGGGGGTPPVPSGAAANGGIGLLGKELKPYAWPLGGLDKASIGLPIALEVFNQLGREDNPGDPGGNIARNLGGAGFALGGGLGGAALGARLGSIVPGPGTLIGAGLGAMVGSGALGGAGRALAGNVYDLARGTPEDRATRQTIRNNEAMVRSQMGLQQEAFPLQLQREQMLQQMEMDRFDAQVAARARDTYQQALLGAATAPGGAYADPMFMQSLAAAGRIGV